MSIYGIIGKTLGHSFSKKHFEELFLKENIDAKFLNFELEKIDLISEIISENTDFKGVCVTIPYKESVIKFLDDIDPIAKEIGAVNSISIREKNGKKFLKGYNTDIFGFGESLKDFLDGEKPKALVLGTGGASKAVVKALDNMGIEWQYVSRTKSENHISYKELNSEIITNHKLIINCTPLGTVPNIDTCPDIDYTSIGEQHFLYDLVYNPDTTLFMQKGIDNKAKTHNGLRMLHLQAEKNWEIWNK